MSKHFKEFFVCPHCGQPRYDKEELLKRIKRGSKYCSSCGKDIASALMEALADIKNSNAG